ncbi:TolC family protein [Robertkochia solimangrovi]|uniref:TolC family protein n=1 Tax=Robertkochia solimangrovi TaxID=2213046 RepID=UPI001180F25F|nr:TolC family protein [Robertkochia solimangrovi]TRZ42591.1 hypothetical protein DMZ48_13915 [Robertkochia solimangrovi]
MQEIRSHILRNLLLLFVLLHSGYMVSQNVMILDLENAKRTALDQNDLLSIQKEKINEISYKIDATSVNAWPKLLLSGNYMHTFNDVNFVIPPGGIGTILDIPVPVDDFTLYQAKQDIFAAGLLGYQPLTQLFRISNGVKAYEAETRMEEIKYDRAVLETENSIEKLYYGIRIQQKKLASVTANVEQATVKLQEGETGLIAGEVQEVELLGLKADLADKKHQLLLEEYKLKDYIADLKTNLDIADSINMVIDTTVIEIYELSPESYYLDHAKEGNPDLRYAEMQLIQSEYGLAAALNKYLPDLGIIGGMSYQGIIEELPDMNYFIGANFTWDILSFGSNDAEKKQYESKKNQADSYLKYQQKNIEAEIHKAYRNAHQALQMAKVAEEAFQFRREEFRIKSDAYETGLITQSEYLKSRASYLKSESDHFAALLNGNIAIMDLQVLSGTR